MVTEPVGATRRTSSAPRDVEPLRTSPPGVRSGSPVPAANSCLSLMRPMHPATSGHVHAGDPSTAVGAPHCRVSLPPVAEPTDVVHTCAPPNQPWPSHSLLIPVSAPDVGLLTTPSVTPRPGSVCHGGDRSGDFSGATGGGRLERGSEGRLPPSPVVESSTPSSDGPSGRSMSPVVVAVRRR